MNKMIRNSIAWILTAVFVIGSLPANQISAVTKTADHSDLSYGSDRLAQEPGGYLLCYTREKDDSMKRNSKLHGMYQSATTDSMHLAYSADGSSFEALNDNTGVLFAKNEGSKTKVLKQPYLFRMKEGGFGVLAVRANEGEEKADNAGEVLFFTSNDLVSYKEVKRLTLSDEDYIRDPACVYEEASDRYLITWTSEDTGISYANRTTDFETVEAKEEAEPLKAAPVDSGIQYAIESNVIALTKEEAKWIQNKLGRVTNTTVDNAFVETEPGKAVDLSKVKVNANYSDGSKAEKSVLWNQSDLDQVDFNREGTYEVSGTVRQLSDRISEAGNYPFIAGRADPNVVLYQGKYYFIATNESGNTGLYIRESDTVTGLNESKEYLVYDEAKAAEASIVSKSNHWAPELHVISGNLYMFFATNIGTGFDVQTMIMKLKEGGNPTLYEDWETPQRYLDKDGKVLSTFYGGITLDMTHFSYNDRHYVVWSQRNFGKNRGTADLWIGETTAENPGQLISEQVKIVSCEYSWERNNNTPVTEGPFVIIRDDVLYLTYSGGATDESYCVGMTQIDLSENVDFLQADSWKKTNYPILTGLSSRGENKYHGPGHNSYVTDEDGSLINVFHGRPGNGNAFQRDAFLRIVHFGADGAPILNMEEEYEILPQNKQVKLTVTVKEKKEEPAATAPAGTTPTPSASRPPVVPAQTAAPETKQANKKGTVFQSGNLQYKITGNKTAEVQKATSKNNSNITVPATVTYREQTYKVTSIAAKAFQNNKKLKQVKIGKWVTAIGAKAFQNCSKLKTIRIYAINIKKTGNGAWSGIHRKASVTVYSMQSKRYKKMFQLFRKKGMPKSVKRKMVK